MKRNLISLIIIGILFSMSLETYAQDDLSVLNIQGVVRDDKGGAVEDGDYQFTFRIYDSEDGTGDLWSETQTLTVSSGVYSANLGETTTFSSAGLGFDKPYYVGVQFESEAEASPRIRLTAAPYALALQGGDNVFPSSGNVGVNTSAPESQFHVVGNTKIEEGDVSVDGNISLDRADNTTGQTLKFNTGSTTGYSLGQEDND
ncbi:MAG: hypothetical protein K9G44_14350, partial [Melioribacteraceae bacterium]|nr:hypothetical protein [Melioribacteraceae bacterium]